MHLSGKTAVVTGGAMGIGLATVKRLLKAGVTVSIWDIDKKTLANALKELKPLGSVFGSVCDVTAKAQVSKAAKQALKDMGRVDILINNAGYVCGGDFLDVPDEKLEKTIDVNLTSMIYTIKAFLPGMYERDCGHIVNISSAAGTLGVPSIGMYCAAKWAVWGLTESLRHEAKNRKKRGVRFSSIHPGYIKTGMFAGAKIGGLGGLLVPLIKDHDTIATCIVEAALKRGRHAPKRPRSIRLTPLFRGLLPDAWFQGLIRFLKIHKSMSAWTGR
jgi:all-trans-retinol dehydrogenase (NAD+)